jgi:hypothetical protein
MSDETKVWLGAIGVIAMLILGGGALIYDYNQHQAELRRAACVNPDSVACAFAVRQ